MRSSYQPTPHIIQDSNIIFDTNFKLINSAIILE